MGHACEILTFDFEMGTDAIEKECWQWQKYNCDPGEHGFEFDEYDELFYSPEFNDWAGPCEPVHFETSLFDNYEQAEKYLNGTFGHYRQTAVKYKDGKKTMWAVACEEHC